MNSSYSKFKKVDNIILVLWAMLLVFNLTVLLYNQSKIIFLLMGFNLGFFLHMLVNVPLLNSYRNYINFLDKMVRKLFAEVEKPKSKQGKLK